MIHDKYMKYSVLLILCLFLSVYHGNDAFAEEPTPPQWPWRGIIVNAFSSEPGDVVLLKKRLGVNALRLELNIRFIAETLNMKPHAAWTKALEWADHMLDACRREGVVGIISISQFPIDPSLKVNQESPEFWNGGKYLTETLGLINQLSEHFKDRGMELAAYEILSEPLVREGESVKVPSSWPAFQMDLINSIKQRDTSRYIIINPPPGGSPNAYRDFKPIAGSKLMYGAHMYLPHSYTHQGIQGWKLGYAYPGMASWSFWDKKALEQSLAALRQFQLKYRVPVWIGEFSVVRWAPGAEQYLLDVTSIFKSYGWGWSYQAYKEYHAWNPDYDTLFATDDPNDWKKHYVGESSVRWRTLKEMFGKQRSDID